MSGKVTRIKLDDDYSLGLEAYNFMLIQHQKIGVNPDTGKDVITRQNRYYPKLQMALERYVQESTKTAEDLEGIFWQLDRVEGVIKELIQKLDSNEKSK